MSKSLIELKEEQDVIVTFTDDIILEKNIFVNVPAYHKAILFIGGEPNLRIDEGINQSIFKLLGKNKAYLNKYIKLGLISTKPINGLSWGFGEVTITDYQNDVYQFGIHGTIDILIDNINMFVKRFGTNKNIDIESIEDEIRDTIKMQGISIVTNFIKDNKLALPDLDSKYDSIKKLLFEQLNSAKTFKDLGIIVKNLTIQPGPKELVSSGNKNDQIDINQIEDKIVDVINERTKNLVTTNDLKDMKDEIKESFYSSISKEEYLEDVANKLASFKEDIKNDINSSVERMKDFYENIIDENKQNDLKLYKEAEENYLNKLKITTDLLIDKAVTDEDLAAPAGAIYSNVEKYFIEKTPLKHINNAFYINEYDYKKMIDQIVSNGGDVDFLSKFEPRTIVSKETNETLVEVPTEFRFYSAGCSYKDSADAARMWNILNKFRHMSSDNQNKLQMILKDRNQTKKEFLRNTLNLYRKLGVYTKD